MTHIIDHLLSRTSVTRSVSYSVGQSVTYPIEQSVIRQSVGETASQPCYLLNKYNRVLSYQSLAHVHEENIMKTLTL
jgi:hypothetical protein